MKRRRRTRRPIQACAARTTSQRGASLVEAVLATVMLAMVGATLTGAVSYMTLTQRRAEQRLGAAELANRLMLQYIDNQDAMPSNELPIEYNADKFRWTLDVTRARFEIQGPPSETAAGGVGSGFSFERVRLVSIRVWLSEHSGGARGYNTELPSVAIARLIDPLDFHNPDSLETILEEPGGLERIMERMMDIGQGGN